MMWPAWFAFSLSFLVIFIPWANHHTFLKFLDEATPHFIYANAFFLATVVVMPFSTALLGDYLNTPYAQPAVVIYCAGTLFHSIAWNLLFQAAHKPVALVRQDALPTFRRSWTQTKWSFLIYLAVTCLAFWFPVTAMLLNTLLWSQWVGFLLWKRKAKA